MNLNKAIIIGNLTQDPEVRTTPNGQSVASFTIATNRVWNNPQGQKQEQAEFHNIVAWGKLSEIVGQYLGKGRLCMVEGRIQTRSWDDQAGNKKYRTEIIAENIQLGPRGQGGAPAGGNASNNNFSNNRQAAPAATNNSEDDEIKIEDIPF
jgi:single-strand DNA-binding protein